MSLRRSMLVAFALIAFAVFTVGAFGGVREDGIEPKNGGNYPPGTVVRGVCSSYGQASFLLVMDYDGNWASAGEFSADTGCVIPVRNPGKYQLLTITASSDGDGGLVETGRTVVNFEIREKGVEDCKGSRNSIASVWTPSGKTYGLDGEQLQTGRTYDFPEDVELTLGDGSMVRMTARSQVRMSHCGTSENRPLPVRMKIILGKVWATVTKHLGDGEIELQTERAVAGNRGTSWSMSYDPAKELTTVQVASGRVWLKNKFGKPKTLELHAGQTATQQGNAQPRLR